MRDAVQSPQGSFQQGGEVKTFARFAERLLVFFHCQARVGARKFQKVILTVSPRGISLQDADTKEMVENISIYRWACHGCGLGGPQQPAED